ncbi:MAG: DNA repair protein RecO [Spirochaetes bacterium]|nr:DNA repair protein RecO [Spirochaetota bacterium]MBN2770537.1 DNA repair protein RecO [Spirochaetota bacterium]
MIITSTEGVVLSSRISSEADIIASVFTETEGLTRFIIKGLKKSKKRDISASDPGTLLNITFYKKTGSSIYYANNFSVIRHNIGNSITYENSMNAFLILELIMKSSAPHMPHLYTYLMLKKAIESVCVTQFPFHLSLAFFCHLIKQQGILPDPLSFPVIKDRNHSLEMNINDNGFVFLKTALTNKFDNIDCSLFNDKDIKQTLYTLITYFENYYHIEILSKSTLFNEKV